MTNSGVTNTGARTTSGMPRPWLLTLLLLAATSGAALGQTPDRSGRAEVPLDPYTKGDTASFARLGYGNVGGPFQFGAAHDSAMVTDLLADEPLCWIETTHFRLGCALSTLRLRGDLGSDSVDQLRAELKVLATKLPNLKSDTRELDPWLRAHLTAQRLERLYSEVAANLRESERDPTATRLADGNGPYLGMRERFTVLLLRKSSNLARYTNSYLGGETTNPLRRVDGKLDTALWCAAEECGEATLGHDLALHAHLAFNVACNLYGCYRGTAIDLPPWLLTGLGHLHARAVSTRFPAFERHEDRVRATAGPEWDWSKRTADMGRNGAFQPLPQLWSLTETATFGIEQQLQSWALVDYLIRTRRDQFLRFVRLYKDPFRGRRRATSDAEQLEHHQTPLRQALRLTVHELETEWLEALRKGR